MDQALARWPKEAQTPAGMQVYDWLECQVLRREAERLFAKGQK
jgi:hypothetical protein